MSDREASLKTGLRQWEYILEMETYIVNVGVFHMLLWGRVICVRHFWEKVGQTLDNTMEGENPIGGENRGVLTLEDTVVLVS